MQTFNQPCQKCNKDRIEQAYCPLCGQKRYESRFTWVYIFNEVAGSFNFERGIFFNFKTLWEDAATAIKDYIYGHTKLFYPPWQYFSIACGVYLFLMLTHLAFFMGISANENADIDKQYFKNLNDKYYQEVVVYLQDSTHKFTHIDSLKNELQKTGKRLADIRFLENDEAKRAEKQAQFIGIFTYLGFYLFPFYLGICSFFMFKNVKLFLSEHLIIHLFLTAQVIFYVSIAFVCGSFLQFLLKQIEVISFLDTDILVVLLQLGVTITLGIYLIRYLATALSLIFEEKLLKSYIKTVIAILVSGGFAFLINFIAGAFTL